MNEPDLSFISAPEIRDLAHQLLAGGDSETVHQTAEELMQAGSPVIDDLLAVLDHYGVKYLVTIAPLLQKLLDGRVVKPLLQLTVNANLAASKEEQDLIREIVHTTIAGLGFRAIDPLVSCVATFPDAHLVATEANRCLDRLSQDTDFAISIHLQKASLRDRPDIAERSVQALIDMGASVVDRLLLTLAHLGRKAVIPISRVFSELHDPRAVEPLLACATLSPLTEHGIDADLDHERRAAARQAIICMGEAALQPLLETIYKQKKNDSRAAEADKCLGQLARDTHVREKLESIAFNSDHSAELRACCVGPLVAGWSDMCLDSYQTGMMAGLSTVDEQSPRVQLALKFLRRTMCDDSPLLRRAGIHSCAKIEDSGILDLLLSACDDSDAVVRRHSIELLAKSNTPEAADAVVRAVDDTDFGVRCAAVEVLGDLKAPNALEVAIKCLADEGIANTAIVWVTIRQQLERAETANEAERVIDAVLKSGLTERRAIDLLKYLNDRYEISQASMNRMTESLRLATSNGNRLIREAAIALLVKFSDVSHLDVLIKAMHDSDAAIRAKAAHSLCAVSGEQKAEASRALVDALRDPVERVRSAAVEALTSRHWEPANSQELSAWAVAQHLWADAISEGATAASPLANILKDNDIERSTFERATQALTQVMQSCAAKVSITDLQLVADLPNSRSFIVFEYNHPCLDDETESFDCSLPKQLARQELARRGIQS